MFQYLVSRQSKFLKIKLLLSSLTKDFLELDKGFLGFGLIKGLTKFITGLWPKRKLSQSLQVMAYLCVLKKFRDKAAV